MPYEGKCITRPLIPDSYMFVMNMNTIDIATNGPCVKNGKCSERFPNLSMMSLRVIEVDIQSIVNRTQVGDHSERRSASQSLNNVSQPILCALTS